MDTSEPGVRERTRRQTTARALEIATRQLGEVGAASLSVRAIARELGLASSAIYRYFPSRDALLTRLIIDAYTDLGAAAADAEARCERTDYAGRFRAAARAARRWALEHPSRYLLVYGTPVPGYAAPQETIVPALIVARLLVGAVVDAAAAGIAVSIRALPRGVESEFAAAGADFGIPSGALLAAGIGLWTSIYGHISFELVGQFTNVVNDRDGYFDYVIDDRLAQLGLH